MFSTLDLECREWFSLGAILGEPEQRHPRARRARTAPSIAAWRSAVGAARGATSGVIGDTVKLQEILNARGKT